jgi:hypothetical protein
MRINLNIYIKLIIFISILPFINIVVVYKFQKIVVLLKYLILFMIYFFKKDIKLFNIEKIYILFTSILIIFSIIDYSFQIQSMSSIIYVVFFITYFYIIFKLSTYFSNDNSINEILFFILKLLTIFNVVGLLMIFLGVNFATDIRYNPFGATTLEFKGFFSSTNYATMYSSIALILSIFAYQFNKIKLHMLFIIINLSSILIYHSRLQTSVAFLLIGIIYLKWNKRLIFKIVLLFIAVMIFNYEFVITIFEKFIRIENIMQRGIFGSRGILFSFVFENFNKIGPTGLGPGNAREIWYLPNIIFPVIDQISLERIVGLNMHSALLTYIIELGILGPIIYYTMPIYLYIKSYKVRNDRYIYILRILLLFYLIISFLNDEVTRLNSPATILFATIQAMLYGRIKYLKLNNRIEKYG